MQQRHRPCAQAGLQGFQPGDHAKRDQKRTGSLSPSSSDTQAAGSGADARRCCTQSLNSVVLPKPAGAETSVSLRTTPSFMRSNRRARDTRLCGGRCMYSFVINNG